MLVILAGSAADSEVDGVSSGVIGKLRKCVTM